jgi:hypothetical protein
MERMTIRYRPTQSDLVHAARAWEGEHWKVARFVVAGLLFACGIYILVLGQWWGGAFVLVGLLEAFNLLPAAVIRAILEFRWNPKFREEYHLSLTPEALRFQTETIDSTLKWTHYSRFFETGKAFILVYGVRMYTVIPKRALAGDDQLSELRDLLTQVIGDRAKVA